ncbi:hypothetical protein AA0113_g7824 [Alternaria arborescens]|uniref:Uncharacterized protein n=1 Tax=Alternaria arborescens TaxID=156630 RepID=A0A4V1X471_9PLEO|nr:hypothetical protein AA0111_g7687 [Alternaria arborescens]RYN24181.1 hypothetical protein AA0112_g9135 [Alternaria arborescens]RYO26884.1 hypothetical protein AA0111_g7687 [Alternaria arborescens]RYO58468.1 hypothetical protein AA0113_g7824 [Alternaria arborescens]
MTVAIANLAQLRKELGFEGQALLDYAPHSKIRYAPQTHDQRAVPFKLLFGQITDKYTKKLLHVWILLYPPNKEGGNAEVQFQSLDPETRHDDSNISITITTIADAFKTPKRGSKNKYVALAKYYFLNIIISRWTEQERQYDLAIPIPITRSLIDALKTACREFEAEAKANLSDTQSRSQSATLVDDDEDSVLSDAPEDPFEPAQPIIPATVPASTYSASASQLVEDLTKLQDEEVELRDSQSKIVAEIAETKLALQEIGETLREDEKKNRVIEEKLIKIAARREQLLDGMSALEAYKLGGEIMKKR